MEEIKTLDQRKKDLLKMGKEEGFLTFEQLANVLKGLEMDAESLDDLYSRTKIAIVPMFDGTGLKIKTITAMSYGIPVVGTCAAVDGFADKKENPCLITNNEKANVILKSDDFIKNASFCPLCSPSALTVDRVGEIFE